MPKSTKMKKYAIFIQISPKKLVPPSYFTKKIKTQMQQTRNSLGRILKEDILKTNKKTKITSAKSTELETLTEDTNDYGD